METSEILKGKYPARAHAAKVASYLQSKNPASASATIYLEGQKTRLLEDNDEPQPFRQRRNFYYLSGCALPDCHLTYHIPTSRLTLFIPPIDPEAVIWSGLPLSPADALSKFDVDSVLPSTSLPSHLASLSQSNGSALLAVATQVSSSTLSLNLAAFQATDLTSLHPAIDTCRVIKDPYEIASVRHANHVTTAAHLAVLRALKRVSNERELEAVFIERCLALGCKEQAYHGIFGAGTNAATLHYVDNDRDLKGKWNVLVDAAAQWGCYCADVTRTLPLSGTFNKESRGIYEAVLRMQKESLLMIKCGVMWEDVHARAHEVALEELLKLGILTGGDKEDFIESGVSVAFFPHGLGHYLGMDTHDTGGNPNYEDKDPEFRYLRVRGRLPAGCIVTVEPGIYFCRFIIEPYLKDPQQAKYINKAVLEKYWDVGGVRIEDDILVTSDGYENLTTTPKEIDEVEKIINGS